MKKQILLVAFAFAATLSTFAQFTFVHLSDMHVSSIATTNSDTNAQYFKCAINEFRSFHPRPAFIVVTGDISDMGNVGPDGMYPAITQHLFPPAQTNPGIGAYHIDSAMSVPIYFTPGNHEYWTGISPNGTPISNDTLTYYTNDITPDTDYVISTSTAVIVVLRSGSDSPYTMPPNPANIEGTGLSDSQISWLRNMLILNSSKRKIIAFHHPGVNARGTNSDGTPYTGVINDTADNSILNNRTNFLNICDSNHVDVVLNGHEHQNVVANRKGDTINENWPNGTRYVQTAAAFNRSYRIVTVDPAFVSVSRPLRSCNTIFGVNEPGNSSNISVFPNPASDKLTIECRYNGTVETTSIDGQIIKIFPISGLKTTIDVADLPGGMYIIKVKSDHGILIRKFIKR